MATFVKELNGYIADVPKVVFRRCDGEVFALDELTAASVSANIDTIPVNAGWSLFAVAILPGQSTFELNFTSGKFDARMFSVVNKAEYKENATYAMDAIEYGDVDANHQITLLNAPIAGTVKIAGLEETDEQTVATGTFKVDAENKKITFCADDEFPQMQIVYQYEDTVKEAIITNKESAIGEASCIWPVYGSGDDCSESAIVGYYIIRVFRARVSTMPGMDSSYKTASTFNFVLTALDAKRNDEGAYSIAYKLK